jgi:hypothetical protein
LKESENMSNLVEKSKGELAAGLQRARAALANAKENGKAITNRAISSSLTVGSGYLVGLSRKKLGQGSQKKLLVPGTEIEADLAIGVLTTLAGVAGVGDENAGHLCAIGSGTLAGYSAITAFQTP